MKKSELVLGNVIKGYKGEKEFQITQINEETVVLDGEKEVKIATLLKNYKFVREAEIVNDIEEEVTETVDVELPTFQLKLVAPIITGLLPEAKIEEKIADVVYGIKVVKGINQTCIWKILKKVCENKDAEGTLVANQLRKQYPDAFKGAVRCLVSKKRINYINSIIEA
ncbi:MAG: hypothetical protein SOZ95_03040 [Bacilli bacterium]|nr:hypothetical protein [Bacilli bacterium]